MLESSFRKQYERHLIEPIIGRISNHFTPLQITLLSGAFILFFVPALLLKLKWLAIGLMVISGYLDTLDGSLARWQKTHSNLGSVFDIMMDRFVECVIVVSLFLLDPTSRGLACVLMLSSIVLCITSFLVVGIFMQNQSYKSFHYSPGIMERAEAFAFFAVMIVWPQWFNPLAYLFSALVVLTALIRLAQFTALETSWQGGVK